MAIERAGELLLKVWEKIEEIIQDLPDLSAHLSKEQISVIRELSVERSATKRKQLFGDLFRSLSDHQKMVLAGIVVTASALLEKKAKTSKQAAKTSSE